MSHWMLLGLAGLFEVAFAISLKLSRGFTWWPAATAAAVAMLISLGLLALAMRHLPVGVAYAMWTGLGAVGTATMGMLLFGESASALKILSLGLIVAGMVGLKLATPTTAL
ncbi:DMT family transporter [Panacagrimonas sp.]|uniref:DMT family transporter n=1 Tax=Panacagrimonas sp. TaxID=2480088 RepID=UPI003B518DE6